MLPLTAPVNRSNEGCPAVGLLTREGPADRNLSVAPIEAADHPGQQRFAVDFI